MKNIYVITESKWMNITTRILGSSTWTFSNDHITFCELRDAQRCAIYLFEYLTRSPSITYLCDQNFTISQWIYSNSLDRRRVLLYWDVFIIFYKETECTSDRRKRRQLQDRTHNENITKLKKYFGASIENIRSQKICHEIIPEFISLLENVVDHSSTLNLFDWRIFSWKIFYEGKKRDWYEASWFDSLAPHQNQMINHHIVNFFALAYFHPYYRWSERKKAANDDDVIRETSVKLT